MKRFTYLAVLAVALAATPELARSASPSPAGGQSEAAAPAIDPGSIAALEKMGAYLRTLKAFSVDAVTTTEDVLDDGLKVQYSARVALLAEMPDKLRVEVDGARQHRFYFYDGKQFTLWAQRVNYYATVPAPPTVAKLADVLADKYDINIPLVDLFYRGTPRSSIGDIKAAVDIGPSPVEGTTCEQYVFRQDGLDWQIWIQQGAYPLPRKLVLTTMSDEARPQYTSVLTWNLAPSFNNAAFTFEPPKDAEKIVFATAAAAAQAAGQQ